MPKGEIFIHEQFCKGCGYCAEFCARGCIIHPLKRNMGDHSQRYSPQGYLLPDFALPEKCNACGVCAWMCPDQAIDVYKLIEEEVSV